MMTGQPRPPMFFPNHLSSYHECPERYFHDRIERRKNQFPPGPELARGIAIHHVLSDAAIHYQTHGTVPSDLGERVRRALPRKDYSSEEIWESEIETVGKEVEFGSTVFDGAGTVLSSEHTYDYHYKRGQDCPPFVLAAKVDLVMLRHDSDGKPFLDVMDFKSGSGKVDSIQEVACRIVVKSHAKNFGVPFGYIQNSTVQTGQSAIQSVTLDDHDFRRAWQQITQIVSALIDGVDWHPIRSPLCEWCSYFMDGCSIAPDPDGPDELGDWLDGVAA
jgi:hypothetical protein